MRKSCKLIIVVVFILCSFVGISIAKEHKGTELSVYAMTEGTTVSGMVMLNKLDDSDKDNINWEGLSTKRYCDNKVKFQVSSGEYLVESFVDGKTTYSRFLVGKLEKQSVSISYKNLTIKIGPNVVADYVTIKIYKCNVERIDNPFYDVSFAANEFIPDIKLSKGEYCIEVEIDDKHIGSKKIYIDKNEFQTLEISKGDRLHFLEIIK